MKTNYLANIINYDGLSLISRPNLTHKTRWNSAGFSFPVRLIGLEPTQPELPDPKSGASTNFATGAGFFAGAKIGFF